MINQYFSDQALTNLDSSRSDGFGYSEHAEILCDRLANTPGNIAVGLRGEWGQGKTSYLRTMQKICLNTDKLKQKAFPVFFNAWQYEQEENPLSALTMTVFNQLLVNKDFLELIDADNKKKGNLLESSLSLAKFGSANFPKFVESLAVKAKVGIPSWFPFASEAEITFDCSKLSKKDKADNIPNIKKYFKGNLAKIDEVSKYYRIFDLLEQLGQVKNKKNPFKIILLIDDLDRCEGDKVKFLLDNLKLILSSPAFAFVFGINQLIVQKQVQNVINKADPRADSGRHYLEKLIPIYVDLPNYQSKFNTFFEKSLLSDTIDDKEREEFEEYKTGLEIIWKNVKYNTTKNH